MNILCLYDFSRSNEKLMDYAAQLLQQHPDSKIHILHIVPVQAMTTEVPFIVVLEDLKLSAENVLSDVAIELKSKAKVADNNIITNAIIGTLPNSAIDYVQINNIDLIIMNTHNKSNWFYRLLGSSSEDMLHASHVPIIFVHNDDIANKDENRCLLLIDNMYNYKHNIDQFLKINQFLTMTVDILHLEENNKPIDAEISAYFEYKYKDLNCTFNYEWIFKKADDLYQSIEEQMLLEKYSIVTFIKEKYDVISEMFIQSTTTLFLHKLKVPILVIK